MRVGDVEFACLSPGGAAGGGRRRRRGGAAWPPARRAARHLQPRALRVAQPAVLVAAAGVAAVADAERGEHDVGGVGGGRGRRGGGRGTPGQLAADRRVPDATLPLGAAAERAGSRRLQPVSVVHAWYFLHLNLACYKN